MAFIPGLLASFLPDIIGGVKDIAENVIGDAVGGKIHSGADFGKSLLGGLGKAIGVPVEHPLVAAVKQVSNMNNTPQTQMQAQQAPTLSSDPSLNYPSDVMIPQKFHGIIRQLGDRRTIMSPLQKPHVFNDREEKDTVNRMAQDAMRKTRLTDTIDHKIMQDRKKAKEEREARVRKELKKEKHRKAYKKAKAKKKKKLVEGKLPKLKEMEKVSTSVEKLEPVVQL